MKYSILVKGADVCYIHQSGHTLASAEYVAKLLNDSYSEDFDGCAIVLTDEEAQKVINEKQDTEYFAVLENENVVFIEITPEMTKVIDEKYYGDPVSYFNEVICEKYDISINNCQWSIVLESCIAYYGKKPDITV